MPADLRLRTLSIVQVKSNTSPSHFPFFVHQNGLNGDLARMNPFYTHYLVTGFLCLKLDHNITLSFTFYIIFIECVPNDLVFCHQESGSQGRVMEDVGRKTSEINLDTIFVPPPDFQSSPLDLQPEIKTLENGAQFSEPPNDLFQAQNHTQDLFQASTSAQDASANGHLYDMTLNSPDLFKPVPAQTQNLSKTMELKSSFPFKDDGVSVFQAAKGEDLLHAERTREVNLFDKSPTNFVDPFKSPSSKENGLFWSPQPMVANPFYTATTSEADLFQTVPTESGELFHITEDKQDPSTKEDLFGMSFKENLDPFSPSSTNTVDPFPSPITWDLFQDVSSSEDPFGTSKQYDPFQDVSNGTPDIFQWDTSNAASKATNSTPSLNGPSEMKLDMLSSADLFKATPSESQPAVRPKSSDRPHDGVLATPWGTKDDILQPSPFSRVRNVSMSRSRSPAEMTHVCNKCYLIFGQP